MSSHEKMDEAKAKSIILLEHLQVYDCVNSTNNYSKQMEGKAFKLSCLFSPYLCRGFKGDMVS